MRTLKEFGVARLTVIAVAALLLAVLLLACGGIEETGSQVQALPIPTADQLSDARGDSYEITTYAETDIIRMLDKEACVLAYHAPMAIAVIQVDENSPLFLDCY